MILSLSGRVVLCVPSSLEAMNVKVIQIHYSTSGCVYRTLMNGVKKKTIFHWIVTDYSEANRGYSVIKIMEKFVFRA